MNSQLPLGEISPLELALRLEAGEPLQVLDVRAPQRLANGRVDSVPPERFFNIPNSQLFQLADPQAAGLDPALPVATVCGHGHSSLAAAEFLAQRGYAVHSLQGGMAAWMQLLLPRELTPPAGCDRLVQFDRLGKGSLGYLIVSSGEAMAVDAPRNAQQFLDAATAAGARIVAVAETHMHADYLSGGVALARRLGVSYYLHPADAVSPYDGTPGRLSFQPLHDGRRLAFGNSRLTVEHTPGHTLGSVSYRIGAAAVFTGDFIFVASIGRPDLAGQTADWTAQLAASLAWAKAQWPGSLRVYPAHYASAQERNADRTVGRTFAEVRAANEALGLDSSQLLAWVEARISTPPEAYRLIKEANLGLRELTDMEAEVLEAGRNECAAG